MADSFLVTGAGGFIGARAVRLLTEAGCRVRGVSLEARPARIADLLGRVEHLVGNLSDPAFCHRAVVDVEFVLHFAARGVVWNPSESFTELAASNIHATFQLIREAGRAGARRVVVAGSMFEYGRGFGREHRAPLGTRTALSPINIYGVTKAASGLLAAHAGDEAGIATTVLRIFTPYGPGEPQGRFVPTLIRAAAVGEPFAMTYGDQTRDFSYVDDIARSFVAAARSDGREHTVLNLGTGIATKLRDVAEKVKRLTGGRLEIEAGAIPYRLGEAFHLVADASDLPADLRACMSTNLDQGLVKTLEWFNHNGLR